MNLTTVHIPRSAPWLPPSLLANPEEIRHRVTITDAEKRVFEGVGEFMGGNSHIPGGADA